MFEQRNDQNTPTSFLLNLNSFELKLSNLLKAYSVKMMLNQMKKCTKFYCHRLGSYIKILSKPNNSDDLIPSGKIQVNSKYNTDIKLQGKI